MTKKKGYSYKPNGKKDTGHPTVMTPETIDKLERAFSVGASDLEACFFAGIGKTTLYNYQAEHPEFVERKEALKERMIFKARGVIAEALNKGDENTAKWYLEKKAKKEFSSREEITGAEGSAIKVENKIDIEKIRYINEMFND